MEELCIFKYFENGFMSFKTQPVQKEEQYVL